MPNLRGAQGEYPSRACRPGGANLGKKHFTGRIIGHPNSQLHQREQAALLISLLFGFDSLRRIFTLAPTTGDAGQLHARLAQAIRQLLTGEMTE